MAIAKNPKIIMTDKEFVDKLTTLANRKTFYRNKYAYNLGLVAPPKSTKEFTDCRKNKRTNYNPYEEKAQSFDCSNLVKSLLNGYDINKMEVGYYQYDLSNTGDCTEAELLAQCNDVSQDFKLLADKPLILYMRTPNSHIGVYLGKVVQGKYNVVECTCAKAIGNGVRFSWVDSDGTRRKEKSGVVCCKWSHHGLPSKWVSNAPQGSNSNEKPKVDYSHYPVLKKGSRGEYVKILQTLLVQKGYNPNGIDGIFGNGCLKAVKSYQSENTDINGKKLVVDGMVGQKTWGSLYK